MLGLLRWQGWHPAPRRTPRWIGRIYTPSLDKFLIFLGRYGGYKVLIGSLASCIEAFDRRAVPERGKPPCSVAEAGSAKSRRFDLLGSQH